MTDETLAEVLFSIGFGLMAASMVLGPFGVTRWAILTASLACCFALAAAVLAFYTWPQEKDKTSAPPEKEKRDDLSK